MSIFIQIASYRDPQLIHTIEDCINQASNPSSLHFGICRQYSPSDKFDIIPTSLKSRARFSINDVLHTESKGVCWARNQVQGYYDGEDYTLQLDSHHRFTDKWDTKLIDMLKLLQEAGYSKPLLTAYAPSFDPEKDPESRSNEAWEMVFDRFIPEGAIFFLPRTMAGWENRSSPKRARFYSAHFAFSIGLFSKEVKHDPEYYFHGEEISIAARAFTHGYDLFHPHKPIVWHEYTRKGRTKCWDDDSEWGNRNEKCHNRNRTLFGMDGQDPNAIDFKEYGFGSARTLQDYEKYAGISFSNRQVTEDLIKNSDPQYHFNLSNEEWESSLVSRFRHCIDIDKKDLPLNDYEFWCLTFEDEDGKEIMRRDVTSEEIKKMQKDGDSFYKIWRDFEVSPHPKSWQLWPKSLTKGWGEKIRRNL